MAGDLSLADWLGFHARSALFTLRRGQQTRDTSAVLDEYTSGWDQYKAFLRKATRLDDWMRIGGLEDLPSFYNVEGRLSFEAFDSADYYRRTLLDCIRRHFPQARSVTEFGCGVGRNLLFLKHARPELQCFGYELCQPGVDVGVAAAAKFGLDVRYAQLDYVNDGPEKYVFPKTDIAFTMFSLEQLPRHNDIAVKNILGRTELGSIHMEPVPENYPLSLRGVLGRIEHRKVDYLAGFDGVVRSLGLPDVRLERMSSAHNPLMFPSLYILKKT
jgi:SAM-dependent methyltransferase